MKKFVVVFLFLALSSPALALNYFDYEPPYGSQVIIGDSNTSAPYHSWGGGWLNVESNYISSLPTQAWGRADVGQHQLYSDSFAFLGNGERAQVWVESHIYDTFEVASLALPEGSNVHLNLAWKFEGGLSQSEDTRPIGYVGATARYFLEFWSRGCEDGECGGPSDPTYAVQEMRNSRDNSGYIDLSGNFIIDQFKVGDIFRVHSSLRTSAVNWPYDMSSIADFSNTGAFSLTSGTDNVFLISSAQQDLVDQVPIPEPSTYLLFLSGFFCLIFIKKFHNRSF